MNAQEHELAVDAILQAAGVEYSTRYLGEKPDALGGKHAMDEWRVTFKKSRPHEPAYAMGAYLGPIVEHFEYFTGLGHRKENPITVRNLLRQGYKRHLHASRFADATTPIPPPAAGVLHSLILDSSACDQSFSDWCSEFGYDTDSRKALATYEACQQNADKLKKVFSREQIESIRAALEDY